MRIIKFILMASFFTATCAQAGLPAIPEIPTTLPDNVRDPLIAKRQPLALRKLALLDTGKAINQSCTNLKEGSAQDQVCLTKEKQFNSDVQSLRDELNNLTAEIDAVMKDETIRTEKASKLTPLTASDTTTGVAQIPHDGTYLTNQVPELKQSPAADRIAKGFQAVINHDWPVALAWWQDALNHDPNNATLKRSVGLAQWMVDRPKGETTIPLTPLGAAMHSAFRGDNAQAIRQFELAKKEDPAAAPLADHMISTLQQQAKDAQNSAYWDREIDKNQRELVDMLNETGMNRLTIGDEEGAQESFNDALFFGMGLNPSQLATPKIGETK